MYELAKVMEYYRLIDDYASEQKIVCPLHEDVNPSMMIDIASNRWFCFGCQRGGDAFDFVLQMERKYNKLNELQAGKLYYRILRTSKVSDIKIQANARTREFKKDDYYVQAYDYYHGLRKVDWLVSDDYNQEAREYMLGRGFTPQALNKAKAKVNINVYYPIIFPMLDNGKFRGWVCRTNNAEVAKKRKYLYNEGFSRATTLVGNYGHKDYVYVCEGYMDRLRFLQNGGEDNIVAILGWKITSEQAQKLKSKGIATVISVLDNDECGKKGTKYLKRFFNVVRWPFLKKLKDIGESSKADFERMQKKLQKLLK